MNAAEYLVNEAKYGSKITTKIGLENVELEQAEEGEVLQFNNDTQKWEAKPLAKIAASNITSTQITVNGLTQGIYKDGTVIPAGTTIQKIIENMLLQINPPTYIAPIFNLSGDGLFSVESGTKLNPTLVPNFTQNDAGAVTNYTLKKNGTNILNSPSVILHTDNQFTIGDANVSYNATVSFLDGVIKKDNTDSFNPLGRILAGTKTSNSVIYSGKRNVFFGADLESNIKLSTSSEVRELAGKVLGGTTGTSFNIEIPVGTKKITIAYPATIRDISTIKYIEASNMEVSDTFDLSLINVEGADGFTSISYKVWTYIPAVPFSTNVNYNVTI